MSQLALPTPQTTIKTDRLASNAMENAQPAAGLKPSTATPASPKRFSTLLPKTPSIALRLVGLALTRIALIAEVS